MADLPGTARKALIALLGLGATAGLFVSIPAEESGRTVSATVERDGTISVRNVAGNQHLKAYQDIVGIWTVCDGDTHDVGRNTVETPEGCQQRLERQLLEHARPVIACTPRLAEPGRDYQRWAAVSLAYNIGPAAYCRSSVDRLFDLGLWRQGCDAFLKWNKAGGRVVAGLTARRKRERAICLKGLPS